MSRSETRRKNVVAGRPMNEGINEALDEVAKHENTRRERVMPRGRLFEKGNPGPVGLRQKSARSVEKGRRESVVTDRERRETSTALTPVSPTPLVANPTPVPPAVCPAGTATVLAGRDDALAVEYAREELLHESRTLYRRSLRLLKSCEGLVEEGKRMSLEDSAMGGSELLKARASALMASAGVAKQVQSFAELIARLEGLLRTGNTTNIAVAYVQSPEWRGLKRRMLAALEPYPEALEALARALQGE